MNPSIIISFYFKQHAILRIILCKKKKNGPYYCLPKSGHVWSISNKGTNPYVWALNCLGFWKTLATSTSCYKFGGKQATGLHATEFFSSQLTSGLLSDPGGYNSYHLLSWHCLLWFQVLLALEYSIETRVTSWESSMFCRLQRFPLRLRLHFRKLLFLNTRTKISWLCF